MNSPDRSSPPSASLHLIIRGLVQGVGFRYWVETRAHAFRISGFVRNLPTGEVEIYAEGPDEELRAFERLAGEGPRGSRVERVESRWGVAEGGHQGFHIRL